jgi:hypothetical protein
VSEESLKALAVKFNLMTGKWMIWVPWTQADRVWRKLVQGLLDGKFGEDLGVLFIKVHGRDKNSPHNKNNSTPCASVSIETDDWTSEEKLVKVAKVIRGLGIKQGLGYKMNLYSQLRILRTNPYNLKPTIYKFD